MTTLIVMSFAVGYITYVLLYSDISRPLHKQISNLMTPDNSELLKKIGGYLTELLACPYCSSFWVTVFVQLVCRYNALPGFTTSVGVIITGLAMTMIGSMFACLAVVTLNLTHYRPHGGDDSHGKKHANARDG